MPFSCNLGTLTSWNPLGHSRPVTGLLYLYLYLYPLYSTLRGTQGPSGRVQKIWPLPGFDLWTVLPVASSYTDYAIPARYKRRLANLTNFPDLLPRKLQSHRKLRELSQSSSFVILILQKYWYIFPTSSTTHLTIPW